MPKTSPVRMTYGFVLMFARSTYERQDITAQELADWANESEWGLIVFPEGLDLEQAQFLLDQDPDAIVPREDTCQGRAGEDVDEPMPVEPRKTHRGKKSP